MAEENNSTYFVGSKIEHDNKTGLSHFILSTSENVGNKPQMVQLHGLLSELPEFSFSVNYEEGPGSEWQDILANFMANDLMSLFNAIGAKGSDFKNLLKVGTWTKQVYAGYAPSTIPLKFRIYTQDSCGQTDAKKWLTYLTKYATIDSEFTLKGAAKNITGAIINAYNTGGDAGVELSNAAQDLLFKKTKSTVDTRNEKEKEADEKAAKLDTVNKQFEAINKEFDDFSSRTEQGLFRVSVKLQKYTNNNNITFKCRIYKASQATPIYMNKEQKAKVGSIDPDDPSLNTQAIKDQISDAITGSAIENSDKEKFEESLKELPGLVDKAINNINANTDDDDDAKTGKFLKTMTKAIDKAGNILISKYGKYRVLEAMNRENCLGEKLWYLNIYNDVIFSSSDPLVVYISEWSYKPSEEMVDNMHVYYDFDITCALDQVYSLTTWQRMLSVNNKKKLYI